MSPARPLIEQEVEMKPGRTVELGGSSSHPGSATCFGEKSPASEPPSPYLSDADSDNNAQLVVKSKGISAGKITQNRERLARSEC